MKFGLFGCSATWRCCFFCLLWKILFVLVIRIVFNVKFYICFVSRLNHLKSAWSNHFPNKLTKKAIFHNLISNRWLKTKMDDRTVISVEIIKTTTEIGEKILANLRIKVSFNTESITQEKSSWKNKNCENNYKSCHVVCVLWAGIEVTTEFPPNLPSWSQLPYIERKVSGIIPAVMK